MPPVRLILEYSDIGGNFLRTSSWVFAAGGLSVLEAAIQAATNSNLLYATAGIPAVGTVTPSDADYPLVTDVALFNFQTVPGGGIQLAVPAPAIGMFGPSSTVIDPTSPLAAAIIAAVIGTLSDSSGNVVTAFISGSKSSRRTEQV